MINMIYKDDYVGFTVKKVQHIKGSYGFRVVFKYKDGSTRTQQKAGFSSAKEADDARTIVDANLRQNKYLFYANVPFNEFATYWLDNVILKNCKYSTYYSYGSTINNHIVWFLR